MPPTGEDPAPLRSTSSPGWSVVPSMSTNRRAAIANADVVTTFCTPSSSTRVLPVGTHDSPSATPPNRRLRSPPSTTAAYLAMDSADAANGTTGGVFKSTNAGQSWTRVYSTPGGGSSSNIKIAVTPAAPQNLYVLVGKSTAQVEVSTNEGLNWTNKGSNFDIEQFNYNCYLFVHPTNAQTIYVGTRDLWRSTNGGTRYTNLTNNFTLAGNYTPNSSKAHPDQHHLYISPSTPNTVYISNDGGLFKSTDGGTTFTSLNATLGLTMFTSYDMHPTDASAVMVGRRTMELKKEPGHKPGESLSPATADRLLLTQ